jgi:hypothetical protein
MRKPLLVMSLSSPPSAPRRPAPSPTPAPRAPVPIRLSPSDIVRACEDDYFWTSMGRQRGNGVVHFMGITGIDYRAFNMADKCTTFSANDTS